MSGNRQLTEDEKEDAEIAETRKRMFANMRFRRERRLAKARQREQMRAAAIRVQKAVCNSIMKLFQSHSSALTQLLLTEINKNFANKSVLNTIGSGIQRIISDVLHDENTKDILLKHLRGGCYVKEDFEESMNRKKELLLKIEEQNFINKLNSNQPITNDDMKMTGGISDSLDEIGVDNPRLIEKALCDAYYRIFTSGPTRIIQTAGDTVNATLHNNGKIKSDISNMIVNLLDKVFDAKIYKKEIVDVLMGTCNKRIPKEYAPEIKSMGGIPNTPPTEEFLTPSNTNIQSPITSNEQSNEKPQMELNNLLGSSTPQPPPVKGGKRTYKNIKSYKKHKTRKILGGEFEDYHIQRLSFSSVIKDAFPVIKGCFCQSIKVMYKSVTPEIFSRYAKLFIYHYNEPQIIDYTKEKYKNIFQSFLQLNDPQIKVDIRNHILKKCPPMKDTEIKFNKMQGGSFNKNSIIHYMNCKKPCNKTRRCYRNKIQTPELFNSLFYYKM